MSLATEGQHLTTGVSGGDYDALATVYVLCLAAEREIRGLKELLGLLHLSVAGRSGPVCTQWLIVSKSGER